MELTDLLPLEKWVELEKEVNRIYRLDANFFNTEGIRITDFRKWANRLCPVVKANAKGQSFICAVAHMSIAAEARQAKRPLIEECDGGLVKIVIPIFVEDEFVGAFGACGYLLDDGDVDTFLINKITDIEEEKLEDLSSDIRRLSTADAEAMVAHVGEKISDIVSTYMERR